ncbi:BppU family phage baseplate upper protein [Enterococcus faecalis]|uniref:BppU family phage baseplate upper protein n=1 Tax=Enterococcus faecalis TaxID=1351 RepID=UPI004041114F
MANKVLHLDFSKDPIMPPIIYGRIGDEKMQTVTVKISRRDEIPDLTGGIIRFEGEPAGGNVKVFDSDNVHSTSIGLQKGTFEYTFPSAVFSVEGNYQRAYFSFEKDGKRDTTGDFKIIVKKNADITNPEAETIITEYNRLVQKLEEAYQKALTKVGADYDDIVIRIEGIKTQISLLLTQINKIVTDAEGRISGVEKTVTDSLNNALKELHAADFYTKLESDTKYAPNGSSYTKLESDAKYYTLASRATIAEAEAGISDTKLMTPFKVFRAIAKWVEGKFVSTISNQTIAGVKNFTSAPMINGKGIISERVIGFSAPNNLAITGSAVQPIAISKRAIIDTSSFSISLGKITMLKAGIISFNSTFSTNVSAGWCNVEICKNGLVMARCTAGIGGIHPGGINDLFDVVVGDVISFQVNSNQATYNIYNFRGSLRFVTE